MSNAKPNTSSRSAMVHVVDDDLSVRNSLQWLIESAGYPVTTHGSAEDFLEDYHPDKPGCLVLDLRMPGMSGQALLELLQKEHIHIPVIIITGHGDITSAVRAMKAGAIDFLEKPFREADLLDRIESAIASDQAYRASTRHLQSIRERRETLTNREREVLQLVVDGFLNKQIARELGISEKTVEVHRANLMRKMQADGVAELVRMVLETGGPDDISETS